MSELLDAVPDDIEAAARRVLERACRDNKAIATAESCTGGLLASLLTDVEGASHAFDRGFVVYTDDAKCDLLRVHRSVLDRCGAVSEETARQMALGALDHSNADVTVAITGFAGPGAPEDEAGLVHFACAIRDGELVHREEHFGDVGRGPVRLECLRTALGMIEAALA
jgi:nicotinamide-nucleotide amidase